MYDLTRIFLLSFITSKRIKLESPGWSCFLANLKPDQSQPTTTFLLNLFRSCACMNLCHFFSAPLSDKGRILGSLYASLHLSKTVYWSVGLSIHRSSHELSHLVTSSYNHSINMRTHRWPYGPCFYTIQVKFKNVLA